MKTDTRHNFARAFTLIELVAVMAIMGLLAVLLVPAVGPVMNGMSLTSGGQTIQSYLSLCRQLAITRNITVEVRFYEVPSVTRPGKKHFSMFQAWVYDANGASASPFSKVNPLPKGVIIDARPTEGGASTACSSTLIDFASNTDKGLEKLQGVGPGNYPYRSFRFRGNGLTDLGLSGPANANDNTWFLTLRLEADTSSATEPPKNFYAIQVDPLTGLTRVFRP